MKRLVQLEDSSLPFSAAVGIGDAVYVSGQIGRDETGAVVAGGVGSQTEAALGAMRRHLHALGAELTDVVKTLVFLVDMGDYAEYNEIYRRYFPKDFPARSTVVVSELAQGALIEIEAVAIVSRRS